MKAATRLKISYDTDGTLAELRRLCRQKEEHQFPPAGQEGQEEPGSYHCKICGTVKTVREVKTR